MLELLPLLGTCSAQVGHAGTLDPNATGLLIVCTGRGTKFCDDFMATVSRGRCQRCGWVNKRLGESKDRGGLNSAPTVTAGRVDSRVVWGKYRRSGDSSGR
jgi:hypothetical protein